MKQANNQAVEDVSLVKGTPGSVSMPAAQIDLAASYIDTGAVAAERYSTGTFSFRKGYKIGKDIIAVIPRPNVYVFDFDGTIVGHNRLFEDVVGIALTRRLGLRLPENFNREVDRHSLWSALDPWYYGIQTAIRENEAKVLSRALGVEAGIIKEAQKNLAGGEVISARQVLVMVDIRLIDAFKDAYRATEQSDFSQEQNRLAVDPRLFNSFAELARRDGSKVTIVTNRAEDNAGQFIGQYKLELDAMVGRRPGGQIKPSTEPLERLLEKVPGVAKDPVRMLKIGDTSSDLHFARNCQEFLEQTRPGSSANFLGVVGHGEYGALKERAFFKQGCDAVFTDTSKMLVGLMEQIAFGLGEPLSTERFQELRMLAKAPRRADYQPGVLPV